MTDSAPPPEGVTTPPAMSLTAAQEAVASALKDADAVAAQYRRRVLDLEDDVTTLRTVLAQKETQLERLRSERDVSVALLREHFSLYREVMGLTSSPSGGEEA